jgi:hypothetical protein
VLSVERQIRVKPWRGDNVEAPRTVHCSGAFKGMKELLRFSIGLQLVFVRISNIKQLRTVLALKLQVVDNIQLPVNKIAVFGQKCQQIPKNNATIWED